MHKNNNTERIIGDRGMEKKYKDIQIGDRYGRWTVIKKGKIECKYDKNNRLRYKQYWLCECSCEKHTVREVNGEALKNGSSNSCGCIYKEKALNLGNKQSKDLTGKRFGNLTVLYFSGHKQKSRLRRYWHCKCDCGEELDVEISSLTSGHTKSCGCLSKNDLTGRRFGKLTVIEKDNYWSKEYGATTYECECDCGNIKYIRSSSLVTGNIRSCGCINKEIEDLVGQQFGELTVLRFVEKKYYEETSINMWECECTCGNVVTVAQNNLKSGNTLSCGCLTRSRGEIAISNILKRWGYTFKEQFRFKDCKCKYTLPFDFVLLDQNSKILCLIEFDGLFHYKAIRYPNMTQEQADENLKTTHIRDEIKNQYCKENSIPLIRVPYWELYNDNLEYFLFCELVKYGAIEEINIAS
jgi:hypothetical protein